MLWRLFQELRIRNHNKYLPRVYLMNKVFESCLRNKDNFEAKVANSDIYFMSSFDMFPFRQEHKEIRAT